MSIYCRKGPLYQTWKDMHNRCKNPKTVSFKNYGGRGIAVCARWDDFNIFVDDMGPRPPGYQIDRIDNDGGYYPENCRWATRAENSRNRRNLQSKTGWRGVSWHKSSASWQARLNADNNQYHIGLFQDPTEAATAVNLFAFNRGWAFIFNNSKENINGVQYFESVS